MPAELPAAYFDANVALAYVSGEAQRTTVVRELLRQADNAQRRIYTSTLSIVEVAFAAQEKIQRALDDETESRIDRLWPATGTPIALVEPSTSVMRRARRLIRTAMAAERSLQAADAVHLATAQTVRAEVFSTYEHAARRSAWSELTGLTVEEPSVDQEPML
jgi:predicted nucleic acid-binding protein